MANNKTTEQRDQFTRLFRFAEEKLAACPAWWTTLHHIIGSYADFKTGAYSGSYAAILASLARRRINVSRNTVRHAIDRLEEMSLVARDRGANEQDRRLRLVLRHSVKQSISDLMDAVARLVGRGRRTPVQREKPAAIGRPLEQRYQRSPTGISFQNQNDQKPENRTSGSSQVALEARAQLQKLRLSWR